MRDQLDCLNVARNTAKYAKMSIKSKYLLVQLYKRHRKSITVKSCQNTKPNHNLSFDV